jgi:hypothetical protein
MKIVKALVSLKMARSGSEANRMVKNGSVIAGGCIDPCNGRMPPYKCTCGGWRKITNPTEEIPSGYVIRIKDGSWRLLVREGAVKSTGTVYDQVPGIGSVE